PLHALEAHERGLPRGRAGHVEGDRLSGLHRLRPAVAFERNADREARRGPAGRHQLGSVERLHAVAIPAVSIPEERVAAYGVEHAVAGCEHARSALPALTDLDRPEPGAVSVRLSQVPVPHQRAVVADAIKRSTFAREHGGELIPA